MGNKVKQTNKQTNFTYHYPRQPGSGHELLAEKSKRRRRRRRRKEEEEEEEKGERKRRRRVMISFIVFSYILLDPLITVATLYS